MTQDDIIRMAREASGGMLSYDSEGQWRLNEVEAQRFAALVAAAERKRIESRPWGEGKEWIARAVEAEREGIAKMIEDAPPLVEFAQNEHGGCMVCGFTPKLAAQAIRARGEK
jgi:hypothetical protein